MIWSPRTLLLLLAVSLAPRPTFAQDEPLAPSPETPPSTNSFLDDLFGRFLPRLGYSYDVGDAVGRDQGGLSAIQAFIPVWEDRTSTRLVFSDSRLLVFDRKGAVGANLGLGGRIFSDSLRRTVGGYVYWDYSDTGRASFSQLSGGIETLGDRVDARANFYVPVNKDRKIVDQTFTPSTEPYFQNNFLLVGGGQGSRFLEQALYGFDTEAGLRFFANDSMELRAFAGMYHYQGEAALQAWGPRGRIEARIRDTLAMGVSVQNDRLFGTTVNLNMLVSFPRLSGRGYGDGPPAPLTASDRLGDPVVRTQQIAVLRSQERYTTPGRAVIDPLTGQPLVVLHVAPGGQSDGSFENPYGSLAEAFADPRFTKGNLVVYDRTQGLFTGVVRLAPGTRLLSSGPRQEVATLDAGMVTLPFSGTGRMPTIQGGVLLASQGTLSGFQVVGSGSAAVAGASGVLRDTVVAHNTLTGDAGAVNLPSVAGTVEVRDNRIEAPKGTGIALGVEGTETAAIMVTDNQITKPTGDGVRIVAGGNSLSTLEMKNNRIHEAGGAGAVVKTQDGSEAVMYAEARGNQIQHGAPGSSGILLEAMGAKGIATLTATIAENQLSDNHGPGVQARTGGTNTLILNLFDNKALSSQAMFSFLLQQQDKSQFFAIDPQTLGARNVGTVVTTGSITGLGADQ